MANDTFFPDNYQLPDASNGYMKFQPGDNKFRIMSRPIIGWVYWIDKDGNVRGKNDSYEAGGKPVRIRMNQPVPVAAGETVKHFWSMIVWNYKAEQFQILEITQKGIQKSIKSLSADEDWGSPLNYDLVVTKTGEKLETEYEVKPKPSKPLEDGIQALYKDIHINLEALFDGKDPFQQTDTESVDLDDIPDSV